MNEQQFKALPPEQRKAHQERLQALGHYTGAIDGNWGEGTKAAFTADAKQKADGEAAANAKEEKARSDKLKEKELELKGEELRQSGAQKDVANATETAKALRRAKYAEDASSPWGVVTEIGAGAPAALTGVAAGRGMGMGINALMDASQTSKNATLAAAAQDRVAGLTTREGARAGTQLAGALPLSSSVARVGARMAPHLGLGGFMAGKGAYMLNQEGEDDPFYPKMVNRAAGIGMLGAGTGIAERGITYGVSPGVPPDAKSIAVIESNQLRRNNQPPEATALTPKQALQAEARAAGITGTSKMNKTQLGDALRRIKGPPLIAPAIAAGLAYSMTPDRADAADGSTGAANGEALTNAGIAGTTAAGTGYGLSKLAKALGRAGRGALGAAGTVLTPMIAADAYDPTPEELNRDRNVAARTFPAALRYGGIEDAYQMAQVPERAPAGGDGLNTARSLEIPEGIPLPSPDGAPPPQDDELAQIEQLAAEDPELAQMLKELILARVAEAQQRQIPAAMESQGAASSQPAQMSAALRNYAQR